MPESSPKNRQVRSELLSYAANILSRRPYFFIQLKNKLIDRARLKKLEDCEEVIDSILQDLQKSGYLNDSYLAIGFVRRLLGKLQGPKIIRFKLHQLGLTSSQISEALASQECQEALIEAKTKLTSKMAGEEEFKIRHRLYQRGF